MNDSIKVLPFRSELLISLVICVLGVVTANGAEEPLAQPLAWQSMEPGYFEYAGLSATGRIYEINRTTYNIAIISDKPFWAPKPRVRGRIALWPANTLLVVHLAPMAPIIIHGQKVRFQQLTPGETIRVQYSIYNSANGGYGCGARRIDG